MASEIGRRAVLAVLLTLGAASARADTYTCTSAAGQKFVRDRYIQECSDVTQTVRNADGSIKQVIEPLLTPDDAAALAECKRVQEQERERQRDARLRDRNLVIRFPDEATHAKFRTAALDNVKRSIAQSEKRLAELAAERKPLNDEAEFYVGRKAPAKLKTDLDANDAATTAQRQSIANQQAEMLRVNALYDTELARLRRLWGGAPAGSLDPVVPPTPNCARLLKR